MGCGGCNWSWQLARIMMNCNLPGWIATPAPGPLGYPWSVFNINCTLKASFVVLLVHQRNRESVFDCLMSMKESVCYSQDESVPCCFISGNLKESVFHCFIPWKERVFYSKKEIVFYCLIPWKESLFYSKKQSVFHCLIPWKEIVFYSTKESIFYSTKESVFYYLIP